MPGDGPYRVQMLYRVGKSLAPFDLRIVASSKSDYAMWLALELFRDRGRWIQRAGTGFGGYAEMGHAAFPTVYGRPETAAAPSCPDAPGCGAAVPFDGSQSFVAKPVSTSRFYFVSAHADVRIEFDSKHWRIKDVPNPGVRRVFGHRAKATGSRTMATAVEHFTSASAPGGRYGSAVHAYVPCERSGSGEARILGRGAVADGDHTPLQRLRCGLTESYPYEYGYSRLQTEWRLEGDVVGVGSGLARLVVFDFPKP